MGNEHILRHVRLVLVPGQAGLRKAGFDGKRNASKVKVLLMLANSKAAADQHGWLSARQIFWLTGVPLGSLLALLPRYVGYQYIARAKVYLESAHRMIYVYHITERGQRYLRRNQYRMPLDRYESEIAESSMAQNYVEEV